MRVKVNDVDGATFAAPKAAERLRELIEPALARGEEVVFDFEGIRHFSAGFFSDVLHRLIVADVEKRLPELLQYENLPPLGQMALSSATDFAVRCRDIPGWAAAAGKAAEKFAERD
jgi:hypothetical protein